MPANEFPSPTKPLSLKQIVRKIIDEPDYAKFIHGEVRKARGGDAAAIASVDAHFKPEKSELEELDIPAEHADALAACTEKTNLIAFAGLV
jgi:hypothetical protein